MLIPLGVSSPILPASAGLQQLLLFLGGVEVGTGVLTEWFPVLFPFKLRPQLLKSDFLCLSTPCPCVLSASLLAHPCGQGSHEQLQTLKLMLTGLPPHWLSSSVFPFTKSVLTGPLYCCLPYLSPL